MEGWDHLMALREIGIQQHGMRQRMRVRRRFIRANTDAFDDMTTSDFVRLYRLPQRIVRQFVEGIREDMPVTHRQSAISVEAKVLSALSFFATGSYQRPVGQDFNLGMSQSAVSRSIHEVCVAVNARLMHRYIRFPETQAERNNVKQRFFDVSGISGIVGCLDCTHIALVKPSVHEETYFNRKGYPSLNVQAICDYDIRFLNINARYPGGVADAYIWRNCAAKEVLMERYRAGERREWLLGDSGYACEPWLVPPILHTEPGTPEAYFTDRHCRTRCCVERSFGLLKARFRCLLRHRCLHYSPERAALIVNTCATLPNIALEARLPDPEPLEPEELAREQDLVQEMCCLLRTFREMSLHALAMCGLGSLQGCGGHVSSNQNEN